MAQVFTEVVKLEVMNTVDLQPTNEAVIQALENGALMGRTFREELLWGGLMRLVECVKASETTALVDCIHLDVTRGMRGSEDSMYFFFD